MKGNLFAKSGQTAEHNFKTFFYAIFFLVGAIMFL